MFYKGGTCAALIYVFKILIELRTHQKNTKTYRVATDRFEGDLTPSPSLYFIERCGVGLESINMSRKKNGRRTILPVCGVYKIENLINGKIYIGKSINVGRRWYEHKRELNEGNHINKHLQSSWNKYGEDCFRFELLEDGLTEFQALEREEYYIRYYETTNTLFGYNMTNGGQSGVLSKESREKLSRQRMGKYNSLTESDIRRIKMFAYCYMDAKEIADIFNVNLKTIRNILYGETYSYILEELNLYLKNIQHRIVKERNEKIIDLYLSGLRIYEIRDKLKLSQSIVEKCVYAYRDNILNKELEVV